MKNFNPSKWQDFPINKDIRRIKKENSKTFWNKLNLLISVIVVCITLVLEGVVCPKDRAWIAGSLCVVMVIIFFAPYVYRYIKEGRFAVKRIGNSQLIQLFDEDIIYNMIIAYEFYKEKSEPGLDNAVKEFYNIEQSYYFEKVVIDMKRISAAKERLIKSGYLSEIRYNNVLKMIKLLYDEKQMVLSEETQNLVEDLIERS